MRTAEIKEITKKDEAGARGCISSHIVPLKMRKRIGSTVYEVNVYFNQDAKETMNDKIMRLVRNDAQNGKAG